MDVLTTFYDDMIEAEATHPTRKMRRKCAEYYLGKIMNELSRFYLGEIEDEIKGERTIGLAKLALITINSDGEGRFDEVYGDLYRLDNDAYGKVIEATNGYRLQLKEWGKSSEESYFSRKDLVFSLAMMAQSFASAELPDNFRDPGIRGDGAEFCELIELELQLVAPAKSRYLANKVILNYRARDGFSAVAIKHNPASLWAAQAFTRDVLEIPHFFARINDKSVVV